MGEVVNLNRFRKRQARDANAAAAAESRIKHGRTLQQKLQDQAEADRTHRAVDQAQCERPEKSDA